MEAVREKAAGSGSEASKDNRDNGETKMDILRREIAPVSASGWEMIDETARETLTANLSVRRFADVNGPFGIGFTGLNLGRLKIGKGDGKDGVQFGTYIIQPLVEARKSFSLKTWELDNLERGAKDIELESLVKACRSMAAFEENAVYRGLESAGIRGLAESAAGEPIAVRGEFKSILDGVLDAKNRMISEGIKGESNLVVNSDIWKILAQPAPGGSYRDAIEREIGGKVIFSSYVDGALLASARGGDLELVLGQDFAIGYHHHTSEEIFLFITESFTFRVITPEALVVFAL